MKNKILFSTILLVLFLAIPVLAQEKEANNQKSCFDYYVPGEVTTTVSIVSEPANKTSSLFSGSEKIQLSFFVKNFSKIRVPDGYLLVRIEKKEAFVNSNKADDIADKKIISEFFLPEKIALNPDEAKWIDYEWQIPESIESGKYIIKTFLLRGKNLNIEGYGFNYFENLKSLNEDAFLMVRGKDGGIMMNREEAMINEKNYDNSGVNFKDEGDIKITQTLKNLFDVKKDINIEYKLYQGNYFSENNIIDSKTENISLNPKESGEASFTLIKDKIKENSLFPYYLRIKTNYDGNEAISTIPIFNKDNFFNGAYPSLSYFPFLENFPIKKGEDAKVLFCVNFPKGAEKSKIKFVLKDEDGKAVAETEKEISSKNSLKSPIEFIFKAGKNYDWLELEASIINENEVADKYVSAFNSEDFNLPKTSADHSNGKKINYKTIGFVLAFIILLVAITLIIRIKKKKEKADLADFIKPGNPMIFLIALFLVGLIIPTYAKAAVNNYPFSIAQPSTGILGEDPENRAGGFNCGGSRPIYALTGAVVTYDMNLQGVNLNKSGSIYYATSDEIGERINFDFVPHIGGGGGLSPISNVFENTTGVGGHVGGGSSGFSAFILGSVGFTNSPMPTLVLGAGAPFGVMAGIGLQGLFVRPHHFKLSTDPFDLQDPRCESFNLNSCYNSCPTALGDGRVVCRSNCFWYSANCAGASIKDELGDIRSRITDNDSVDIALNPGGGSVLDCNEDDGYCEIVGVGTATVTVTLPPRGHFSAFYGVYAETLPTAGRCSVNNNPPGYGLGITPPISKQFTIRIDQKSSSPKLTVIKRGSCVNGVASNIQHVIASVPGYEDSALTTPRSLRCYSSGRDQYCDLYFTPGTRVDLSLNPAPGSNCNVTWSGDGAATASGRSLIMNNDQTVQVDLVPQGSRLISISKKDTCGNAISNGLVTSSDNLINCGALCNNVFSDGSSVNLTAQNFGGCTFDHWENIVSCDGSASPSCAVSMTMTRNPWAIFNCGGACPDPADPDPSGSCDCGNYLEVNLGPGPLCPAGYSPFTKNCGTQCCSRDTCSCDNEENLKHCGDYYYVCPPPARATIPCTGTKKDCGEWIEIKPE